MVSDGKDFAIGDNLDLTNRLSKKGWFIGTGAEIAAKTFLEEGMHAYCTSTGSGFIAKHEYYHNGSAWIDQTANLLYVINMDDTDVSVSGSVSEVDVKTYSLAANTYSKIIVVASVSVSYDANESTSVTGRIYIGATSKSYSFQNSGAQSSNQRKYGRTFMLNGVLQAGGTIKVTTQQNTLNAGTLTVHNMYVYGVL